MEETRGTWRSVLECDEGANERLKDPRSAAIDRWHSERIRALLVLAPAHHRKLLHATANDQWMARMCTPRLLPDMMQQ